MAKKKINMKQISQKISKSTKFKKVISSLAQEQLDEAREKIITKFEEHPITQEIEAGPGGSNSSGTLDGYGNLFSFIGFHNSSDPIAPLKKLMRSGFKLMRSPKMRVGRSKIYSAYSVSYPDLTEFYKVSSTPWGGRSWIQGIEDGMSGFGNYMYGKFNVGRSRRGVQNPSRIRTANFRPMEYITEILKEFKEGINR